MGFVSLPFVYLMMVASSLSHVIDSKGEKGSLFRRCDEKDVSEACCVDSHKDVFCLPLFAIVGAMKCATGILRKWLNLHPHLISGSGFKFTEVNAKAISTREVHFFSPENGFVDCRKKCSNLTQLEYIAHYRTHFKTLEIQSNIYHRHNALIRPENKTWKFTFDKSPDYMRSVCALEALKCTKPDIKIIIILRNPTERSFSEFNHHCRHRRYRMHSSIGTIHFDHGHRNSKMFNVSQDEDKRVLLYPCTAADFHDYLFHQCHRSDSCEIASVLSAQADQDDDSDRHHNGYHKQAGILSLHIRALLRNSTDELVSIPLQREITHGFFHEQLLSIFTIFQPERVLILLQEDMRRSLKDTLSTVESFLGLQHFAFNTDRSKTQSSLDFLSRVFNALRERISHYYYPNPTQAFRPRPSKKMEMLPDTRRLLDQIYSTHNRRLRELLEKSPNPQHRHLLTGQGADWLRRS